MRESLKRLQRQASASRIRLLNSLSGRGPVDETRDISRDFRARTLNPNCESPHSQILHWARNVHGRAHPTAELAQAAREKAEAAVEKAEAAVSRIRRASLKFLDKSTGISPPPRTRSSKDDGEKTTSHLSL